MTTNIILTIIVFIGVLKVSKYAVKEINKKLNDTQQDVNTVLDRAHKTNALIGILNLDNKTIPTANKILFVPKTPKEKDSIKNDLVSIVKFTLNKTNILNNNYKVLVPDDYDVYTYDGMSITPQIREFDFEDMTEQSLNDQLANPTILTSDELKAKITNDNKLLLKAINSDKFYKGMVLLLGVLTALFIIL